MTAASVSFVTVFCAVLAVTGRGPVPVGGTPRGQGPAVVGSAAAAVVLVGVAVGASGGLRLLPRAELGVFTVVLFLLAAGLLRHLRGQPRERVAAATPASRPGELSAAFRTALLAETGDLTVLLIVALGARYDSPAAVGGGALLALLALVGTDRLRRRWPPGRLLRLLPPTALVIILLLAGVTAAQQLPR